MFKKHNEKVSGVSVVSSKPEMSASNRFSTDQELEEQKFEASVGARKILKGLHFSDYFRDK